LESALRESSNAPAPQSDAGEQDTEPFAANADVDALLRWRLLYLERRVAHLQQADVGVAPTPIQGPVSGAAFDADRWKWRARYLEARVRHLEERAAAAPVLAPSAPQALGAQPSDDETPPPPKPTRRGVKPAVLGAARDGAPDDFTLIEGVTLLQQSTLNALGVFHFDQIAAWSADNAAWVDSYLRLGGRIDDEEWIEQAQALADEGPGASRRALEEGVT
jgi:NADH-quinone oxidoreductase subunit E